MKVLPIILAGGSGTRLWPLSRFDFPKQFLNLNSDKSLFQETLLRLKFIDGILNPIIVCNESYKFTVLEQCRNIGISNPEILLEPEGRNTAPALCLASLYSQSLHGECALLILSSDHFIQDNLLFNKALSRAIHSANQGFIVTYGIKPTCPNNGFGYIKLGKKVDDSTYLIDSFIEKPNQEIANKFFNSNLYFWNAGIFTFLADNFLRELGIYQNDLLIQAKNIFTTKEKKGNFIFFDKSLFCELPSISVDYALLEKSQKVSLVKLNTFWSDLGSWDNLYELGEKDEQGNVISGDVLTTNTSNSLIRANKHMIATIGVDDLIIVDTPDALLVSSKNCSHDLSDLVKHLKDSNRKENSTHLKVFRPWGYFETIEVKNSFQVKRLFVKPGEKLSLQRHKHRSEHWIIVSGIADVVRGEEEITLSYGDSIDIPVNTIHRIGNSTNKVLEVIEVQIGSYLGEDDIERFGDIYGRN